MAVAGAGPTQAGGNGATETMILADLLKAIPVQAVNGGAELEVRGLAIDSRRIEPGGVFVAVSGEKTDGHVFLNDAKSRGAVAVVSERAFADPAITSVQTPDARKAAGLLSARFFGEPAKKIDLVGITGTNGKSTTAYLVDAILERLAPPAAMMGTVVHRVGDERVEARHTTPEAPEIQSFLARAVRAGCRFGVLEVSSHGLALSRLEGTEFAVAVFTNLTRDHLDFHGDMEEYFSAKRKLFERHLRPGAVAVVCIDDSYGRRLASELPGRVLTYGSTGEADLRIGSLTANLQGIALDLIDRDVARRVESPLIGRHNALNVAAAFGAACALGFDADRVLSVLEEAPGAPGRYERIPTELPFTVIVDYAHTDDALRQVLETTRALPHGRIVTVFGCGGDRDRSKRPLMGAVAARLSDVVVLTSDNPRGEDPMDIIREIELGAKGPGSRAEVRIEPDRRQAIALAVSAAQEGDVILVAGKGHESHQVIGDRVLRLDDREVAGEALAARARSGR